MKKLLILTLALTTIHYSLSPAHAQTFLRISGDSAARYNPNLIDSNTSQSLQFIKGDYVWIDLGLFDRGNFRTDLSQFTNVQMSLWDSQAGTNLLMLETIWNTNGIANTNGSWNPAANSNLWVSNTGVQTNWNAQFQFSDGQTALPLNNQAAASFWLRVTCTTTDAIPRVVTYIETPLTVWNGPSTTTYIPPSTPGALIVDAFGNLLTPANFFAVNSNLLNASVAPSGGGGGSGPQSSLTITNPAEGFIQFNSGAMQGSYIATSVAGAEIWEVDQDTTGWYIHNLMRNTYPINFDAWDDNNEIVGNFTIAGTANGTGGVLTVQTNLITPSINLNGDTRTAWPSGGGGSDNFDPAQVNTNGSSQVHISALAASLLTGSIPQGLLISQNLVSNNETGLTLAGTWTGPVIGSATSATNFSGSLAGDVTGTQAATVVGHVGGATAAAVASATAAANAASSTPLLNTIVKTDPTTGTVTFPSPITIQGTTLPYPEGGIGFSRLAPFAANYVIAGNGLASDPTAQQPDFSWLTGAASMGQLPSAPAGYVLQGTGTGVAASNGINVQSVTANGSISGIAFQGCSYLGELSNTGVFFPLSGSINENVASKAEQAFARSGTITNFFLNTGGIGFLGGTNGTAALFTNAPGATPVFAGCIVTITGVGSSGGVFTGLDSAHGVFVTNGEMGCIGYTNTATVGAHNFNWGASYQ